MEGLMSIVLHRELGYGLACKSNGVAFPRGLIMDAMQAG